MEKEIAYLLFDCFLEYIKTYNQITAGAKSRFENKAWDAQRQAVTDRIELHERMASKFRESLNQLGPLSLENISIKEIFSSLEQKSTHSPYKNLGYTFFLAQLRRIFPIDANTTLWGSIQKKHLSPVPEPNIKFLENRKSLEVDLFALLLDLDFSIPFSDPEGDAKKITQKLKNQIPDIDQRAGMSYCTSLLYRNEHAYVIGFIIFFDRKIPFTLALENKSKGLVIDACLLDEASIKNIFAFSRSYIQVETTQPDALVAYILEGIPSKSMAQLYINLGYQEHGKELMLLENFSHWIQTKETFSWAPGTKGTVMLVFCMPSIDAVFKILLDKFGPNKDFTHAEVMEKYKFIATHDRVGRLVDAQRFEQICFPITAFEPSFLESLLKLAPKSVSVINDQVVITNIYLERKLKPLNIYLFQEQNSEKENVIDDLGNCIKELALTDIFPGDLLLKNFGVTKEKRVIFYDYDEIMPLSTCHFHIMPEDREPTFPIMPTDIFPEELLTFLMPPGEERNHFLKKHHDLFGLRFWDDMKNKVNREGIKDLKPYKED